MYTPVTPTLLPSSMFNAWFVSALGTIKDLVPSPALKPILAPLPHWMSSYMKNTKVICLSATITTWNVFSCNNKALCNYNQLFIDIYAYHKLMSICTGILLVQNCTLLQYTSCRVLIMRYCTMGLNIQWCKANCWVATVLTKLPQEWTAWPLCTYEQT